MQKLHAPLILSDVFKLVEFDRFRNNAGSNPFTLSPKQWIAATNAVGLKSRATKEIKRLAGGDGNG